MISGLISGDISMCRVPGPEMLPAKISPTGEIIVQGIKKVFFSLQI